MERHLEGFRPVKLSVVLEALPSDEELAGLFPHPKRTGQSFLTHNGLMILKMQLSGLSQNQIAKQLGLNQSYVNYWAKETMHRLRPENMPDNLCIDIPALNRLLGMEVPVCKRYSRLSELLEVMPSDEELKELYAEKGYAESFMEGRYLTHRDLYIVQQRLAGRTYAAIGRELGVSGGAIRRVILPIYYRLVDTLGIEIDVGKQVFHRKP